MDLGAAPTSKRTRRRHWSRVSCRTRSAPVHLFWRSGRVPVHAETARVWLTGALSGAVTGSPGQVIHGVRSVGSASFASARPVRSILGQEPRS